MRDVSSLTALFEQVPAQSTEHVTVGKVVTVEKVGKVVTGQHLAKATVNYPKWKRARDAAAWARGEVMVTPTIRLAALVFGISPPLVKAELERRERSRHHTNGTTALSDDVLDRIVCAIGADRMLAAIDRATQPQLALPAAE
jgi:hypothetical protein